MNQKKTFFCVVFGLLIMLTPVLAYGQFRVENETRSNLNILFQNPDFEIKQEMIGASEYDYVSTQVLSVTVDVGAPELPFYSSTIEIPNTGKPSINIRVLESELIKDVNIKPFRENDQQQLTFDNEVYTKNIFYPATLAQIGEPAILRNKRIVNFIVNPFRYNDATNVLEVIKKAEIEIIIDNEPSVNEITRSYMRPNESFENFFASTILNYKEPTSRVDFQNPTILYIYPAALEGNPISNNLFNWRKEQGWTVYTASTTLTGTSNTTIKAYIQNAYDTWENPPAYVTFIGDAAGAYTIPVYQASGSYSAGGDHWYGLLEGNDDLEDVFLGRLSIETLVDLSTLVTKTIKYEKASTIPDSTYFTRALLVADTTPSGQSTIITNLFVKEAMTEYNDDFTFIELYGDSPSPTSVSNGMNAGVGFWNYRGWIGMDGWGASQAAALTNVNKLTITVILTCSTGTFYSGTSITESIVRAGSAASPTGGVCSIGLATSGTHTTFNNNLNGGIMGYLFQEDGWTMGAANNRGKFHLWEAYGISRPDKVSFFSTICNLIGDSALRVYKDQPKAMETEYIENIAAGTDQYKVKTTKDGIPFSNVWATLNIGDEYFTGYTNSFGEIFFDIPTDAEGEGKLTVSKEGYQPQQYDLNFGLEAPVLNATGITLYNDGAVVDYLSPGKSFSLEIDASNVGSADVTNISATISAISNGIIITNATASFGSINLGETVNNSTPFEFAVPNRAYEDDIAFRIILSNSSYSWERQILVPIQSPIVEVVEYDLVNSEFAPGQTSVVNVEVINAGNADLTLADATLSTTDNRITINMDEALLGALASGATGSVGFNITASDELLPGNLVPMTLTINDDGFETSAFFSIQVGEASITDPLGPDAYGYYIFDSYDTEYDECPVYDWVELNPSQGGVGTVVPLPDNGDNQEKVEVVDLPFTFRFYGRDYDEISICSNGWLAMGVTEQATFRNWRLPGLLGPSPMIAPFWDDLVTGGTGQVFIAHDQAENYFVVTWNNWKNHYNTSYEETFQVILYDPEYYSSSTGDAPIKIQYKVVNNIDTAGGNSHGEYATVGIEDHSGTVGLEYTYNNTYPTAARPLENELALYITTIIGQLPPFVMNQPNDIIFEEDYTDSSIDLYNIFKDPNNDVLEFSFSESENLSFEVNEDGYLVITPAQDWFGTETVTIYAEDGVTDIVVSVSFLVTVTPVNDRPSIQGKIPETTNFESNTNFIGFSVDVLDVDSELTYLWRVNNEEVEGAVSDTLYYVFQDVGEHQVKCYASDQDFTVIATWNVNVAVSNDVEIIAVNELSQNNPNPFNPSTSINFSLKKNSMVSIVVYNIKGQKVKTLVSDHYNQGKHTVVWDGSDDNNRQVSSGVYFYRMLSDEFQSTKKAIMMK
ncbi:T9SS type A sorting domain-containing protein [bacterium]|nr:T9SS type A sorting domain-containing protein [bacterium]